MPTYLSVNPVLLTPSRQPEEHTIIRCRAIFHCYSSIYSPGIFLTPTRDISMDRP
jgi:hypothetical protein